LNPIADAVVDSAEADENFGLAGALSLAAPASSAGEFDTFMEFDFSSLEASLLLGARVQSVTLELTSALPLNPIFNSSVAGNFTIEWITNDAWIEGTGNPNAPDPNSADLNFTNHLDYLTPGTDQALGTFSFNGSTSGDSTYTLALAPNFVADMQAGNHVSLYFTAADAAVSYLFNSEDFQGPDAAPVLSVTLVPEPKSRGLLLAGLSLFAANRRRGPQTTRL
jgi:hypothetical protein